MTEAQPSTGQPAIPSGWQRHAGWLAPLIGTVLVGVLSLLAHEHLPPGPDLIGHSAAVWLAFSFYLGARSGHPAKAVYLGCFGLIAVVLVYYGSLRLFMGRADVADVERFWLLAAVVGGPIYGGLGYLYRSRRTLPRGFAAAALGAVFLAEALNYRSLGNTGLALTVEAVVGLVLPFVLARDRRTLLATWVCLPALLALGVTAFEIVDELFWRVA